MPTNRKRRARNRQKCPIGLWGLFTDRPLPESHPEFNSFQVFLRPSDWPDHKKEVLAYWMNKQTKPGEKIAVFLQKEDLLTDAEYKLLGIKKPSRMDKWILKNNWRAGSKTYPFSKTIQRRSL
jgi:hypothetical protein